MSIFLSYAEEDGEIARMVVDRLDGAGHRIFNWRDPRQRGGRFMQQIERGIRTADSFIALLSPNFLRSSWCRRELEMAINRESEIQQADPDAAFIHVVNITHVPLSEAGVLGGYDWLDMTSQEKRNPGLRELAGRFGPGHSRTPRGREEEPAAHAQDDEPLFRNRDDELRRVSNGLINVAGPHFWLVVAPPQLGKSFFLRRISTHDALSGPVPWVVRLVDLRSHPAEVRGDGAALLRLLFEHTPSATADQETLRIAQKIGGSGQPHLCLLDSAELLTKATATSLQTSLSQIYRLVQRSGQKDLRLAFIVASRRDDEWMGVTPLRLVPLPLTEFTTDVVQQALHDLSAETGTSFSPEVFTENATRVHRVTEGLPALLARCLQWIQAEGWFGMERLETREQFEFFADPYIQQELLTPASLLPDDRGGSGEPLRALVDAYRVLAPYRLFTQSHLRHHLESDRRFSAAVEAAGWAMADLWTAINNTALLRRPLNEPWREIHIAIRRLLYRYFYRSDEQRAEAQSEARKFVEVWADDQVGTEQVVGLVECLWHEACALGLRNPAEMEQRLSASAGRLSAALRASTAFTLDELREFAAQRMRRDDELGEAVDNGDGLLNRLIDIVLNPEDSAS